MKVCLLEKNRLNFELFEDTLDGVPFRITYLTTKKVGDRT